MGQQQAIFYANRRHQHRTFNIFLLCVRILTVCFMLLSPAIGPQSIAAAMLPTSALQVQSPAAVQFDLNRAARRLLARQIGLPSNAFTGTHDISITFHPLNSWSTIILASQTFTTTTVWNAPIYITSVTAQVWGDGGGGESASTFTFAGSGGGGGGYAQNLSVSVTPGNNYTATVGTGGAIGTTGNGSKFIGDSITVSANGGGGATVYSSGGAGGTASGGTGGTASTGGNGGLGFAGSSGAGGGGGGAAGPTGAGTNGVGGGGADGGAGGGTNSGNGGNGGANTGTAGSIGGNYGGGGGGGGLSAVPVVGAGGVGAPGLVILTWTLPPIGSNLKINTAIKRASTW